MELQRSLLNIAGDSGCTFEEVFLAGCNLVGNAIAQAHVDNDQTRARIRKATQSIEFIVNWALADSASAKSQN